MKLKKIGLAGPRMHHHKSRFKPIIMNKSENLKKQIDSLPPAMIIEVEKFIKELKKEIKTTKKQHSLLSGLAAFAIDDDLPSDLAEQHDHYLYGTTKK